MLHIIFMGTGVFGIPCLEYLTAREDIRAVVTKPPVAVGRGNILRDTPVKEAALKKGLKVMEVDDANSQDFAMTLRGLNPDLNVVVAFGKILPRHILTLPAYGSINIHASLLPLYRGPSPINWAIINGEKESGVTSFFMEEGIDTGPIISQRSIFISPEDDSGALGDRLGVLAVDVLSDTLDKIKNGKIDAKPQDERYATFAPKLTRDTSRIDWSWDAQKICNLIRGVSPKPGAYTFFKKDKFLNKEENGAFLIKIWKANIIETGSGGEPGRVMGVEGEGLRVFSGKGIVRISVLQPAGKKKMSGRDFWSGYG